MLIHLSSRRISRVLRYSSVTLSCDAVTGLPLFTSLTLSPTGLSPSLAGLSRHLLLEMNDERQTGLFQFRSPLLPESRLLSIPRLTKMFQFSRFPITKELHLSVNMGLPCWVSPFGHPRIKACWQLPEAYRSLLRPSSAISSKASPVCTYVRIIILSVATLFAADCSTLNFGCIATTR